MKPVNHHRFLVGAEENLQSYFYIIYSVLLQKKAKKLGIKM